MLAYILALAVGIGSLAIYMAAFFFPEVHRKSDFIWSGVGLFYALVLWVCAGRITGGVLLGQTAGVALLGWFGWQTLTLRRELIPVGQQTPIPSTEKLQEQLSNLSPPGAVSQLPERLTNLFTNAIGRIQSTLGAIAKRKGSPPAGVPQQPATPKTPAPSKAPQAEARGIVTEVIEIIPLGAEPTAKIPQPAGSDMPGASGKEPIPVEEIAPEVELAPPAEPPGLGEPQDKQSPPPPPVAMETVPMEMPQTAPSVSESAPGSETPELIRPNPPEPEIVEAAIEDAEAKSIPASPPATEPPKTEETPSNKSETP